MIGNKLTCKLLGFLGDIETEFKRRLDGLVEPDLGAHDAWKRAIELIPEWDVRKFNHEAFNFAKNLDYRHGSMSSEVYFCHPLRVAALSIFACDATEPEVGIVGILHNVLEVSTVCRAELKEKFGGIVEGQIAALTVNRELEWDESYKLSYYQKINEGPRAARVVKVIDKLDNIFLINQNPNLEIRLRYLREIERHVIPMARREIHHIADYIERLIAYCRVQSPV